MKKASLLLIALLSLHTVFAQHKKMVANDTTVYPYLKLPTLPAFNILLQDSSTLYNTYNIPAGKPTVMLLFSPDCEHCQKFIAELLNKMDSLKGVNFVLFTPMPLAELRPFAKKLELAKYKNILAIGKDYLYFSLPFYNVKYVPVIAVYDKKKHFIKRYEGTAKVHDLIELVQGQ